MNLDRPNDLAELPHQKTRSLGTKSIEELRALLDRRDLSDAQRLVARFLERRERAEQAKLKHAGQ